MSDRYVVQIRGDQQRRLIEKCAWRAPLGHYVTFAAETRTLEQNSKLWPVINDVRRALPEIAVFNQYDTKLRFMHSFNQEMRWLPTLEDDGYFPVGHSTSVLSKQVFSDLLTHIMAWGDMRGVIWNDPSRYAFETAIRNRAA